MKLIGSKTCPFVQRCLILLFLKKVSFEMVYIDLMDKPDWFMKISPTGKVPILEVEDQFIFESMIINEYLDETFQPILYESNSLQRARNRSWSEFSSSLIMKQHALVSAQDKLQYDELIRQLNIGLAWLENSEIKFPYFNGKNLSLIDIAFAPLFLRLELLDKYYSIKLFLDKPNLLEWSRNILSHPSVKNSVSHDYESLIIKNIQNKEGIISSFVGLEARLC